MNQDKIFDYIPIPLIIFDLQNDIIINVNEAFSELVDIPIKEMIGKECSYLDSFISAKDEKKFFSRIYSFASEKDEIVFIRGKNDVKSYYYKSKTNIEDESAFCICGFEEEHINESEIANQSANKFLIKNGHDLRSALNTLLGISQIIHDTDASNLVKDMDANILLAGQTVLKILNELEASSHDTAIAVEPEPPKPNLVQLIKNIIRDFEQRIQERKIQLKFISQKKIVEFNTDIDFLLEAIKLLLQTAVQSTENNEINITLYEKTDEKGPQIVFKITNNGIGIKKTFLDILSGVSRPIFNSDVSKEDQIYLNLSKCKNLVEDNGGTVVIESRYGIGITVTVSIYNNPTPVLHQETAQLATENTDTGIHEKVAFVPDVLLVDDDQLVYRIVSRYLKDRCNMEYAIDGRRALLAVARKHYDIILMDINLGIGLTGLQVVKKVRQIPQYFETPIVAITAYAMPGDKTRAIDSGCTFYQSKPFTRTDIISVFNQCLQKITGI
ncbi:MAG: response regulator [Ignavibacteriales bacterium]|nr:response regulator [Ignavibacteriales bacterium]